MITEHMAKVIAEDVSQQVMTDYLDGSIVTASMLKITLVTALENSKGKDAVEVVEQMLTLTIEGLKASKEALIK